MRLRKDEVEKLGAAAYVVLALDLYRTSVFKETNLSESPWINRSSPIAKEKKVQVWATALSDPAGYASALYGVSRKVPVGKTWIENDPRWFVIDRKGTLTYAARPIFGEDVKSIDHVLDALKKAAR